MKKLLLLIIVLFSITMRSQQMTVFYKEKRIPSQVNTRYDHSGEKEIELLAIEIIQLKATMKAEKNKDSIQVYEQRIQDLLSKLKVHTVRNKQKSLKIPKYDYITVLKLENKKTLYYPQNKAGNDTVSQEGTNEKGDNFKNVRINYYDSEVIYIDQSQNKKTSYIKVHEFDFRGREFLIEEVLDKQEWALTKETKKVKQYVCYKAVLNNSDKKVEAWYTKEIIANHGPKGYYGLPGLILELKEGKKTVRFHKIQLLSSDTIDIKPPTEGEKITREELKNLPSKLFNQY
ncbi:GLPGLI family protein [Aquimarina sp. LLG6339-5]|uniref:GLPGLI family protein n=2 Tax=Aquimarina TaxID=290174 RepID=UPI0038685EFB